MNRATSTWTSTARIEYRPYRASRVATTPRLKKTPVRNRAAGRGRSGGVTMDGCYPSAEVADPFGAVDR
jgi:hypothetical protein